MTAALTLNVTHLVAKEVGSKKYEVASENNIPSVFPSWIQAAWEKSQYSHFLATDEVFVKEHMIPIFQVTREIFSWRKIAINYELRSRKHK